MAPVEVADQRVVSPTLVGRATELDLIARTVAQPPAVVVVDGEVGIGKTRLVNELLARPEVAGRRLLVGRCQRIRESFPLGAVIEAVRGPGGAFAEVDWSPVAFTEVRVGFQRQDRPDGAGPQTVPLLLLDYDLDVDLTNTAERAGGRGADVIGLRAHHQAGARGAPVAGARLWVSYDDGGAWRELPARKRGSARYDFVLDRQDEPGAGGYVSLRAEAWDKAGNRIEQKVIRAYALPGNAGPQPTGTTERVSVASDGTPATGTGAKVSADGRYVAFASSAATLVPEDRNNTTDIFVRGRQAGTVERVSVGSDRTEADSFSSGPAISADGRYVGFTSRASDLVAGDTNAETDVFVYDRQTGDVERVSVARDGTEANAGAFTAFAFSADGRFTAFVSSASNLVPGDTNGRADTFVRDRGQPR